jgi:hypothetical protein
MGTGVSGVSYKLSENREQTDYKEYKYKGAVLESVTPLFIVLKREEKNKVYSILCNNTTSDEQRTHLGGKKTGA